MNAESSKGPPDGEVFGIFAGLSNISNISALALGNCLEYSSAERFIKFKMSKHYIMTIKNEDPASYDLSSRVSKVPASLYVNHVFPYLTAWELFRARSVCKEWLGHVKDTWHSTFKREMYVQLLAGEFCKDIEFFYKLIQLRNPFFQKLSLLLHALIEIIDWNVLNEMNETNSMNLVLKRVLLVLLRLLGDPIDVSSINAISEEVWAQHRHKVPQIKDRVS